MAVEATRGAWQSRRRRSGAVEGPSCEGSEPPTATASGQFRNFCRAITAARVTRSRDPASLATATYVGLMALYRALRSTAAAASRRATRSGRPTAVVSTGLCDARTAPASALHVSGTHAAVPHTALCFESGLVSSAMPCAWHNVSMRHVSTLSSAGTWASVAGERLAGHDSSGSSSDSSGSSSSSSDDSSGSDDSSVRTSSSTSSQHRVALYAGSFDPPSEGHLDIINRALQL